MFSRGDLWKQCTLTRVLVEGRTEIDREVRLTRVQRFGSGNKTCGMV